MSIVALRRMNSEASSEAGSSPEKDGPKREISREHKRYMSLGRIDGDEIVDVLGDSPSRDVMKEAGKALPPPPPPLFEDMKGSASVTETSVFDSPGSEETLRTPRSDKKRWKDAENTAKDGDDGDETPTSADTTLTSTAKDHGYDRAVIESSGTRRSTVNGPRAMPSSDAVTDAPGKDKSITPRLKTGY